MLDVDANNARHRIIATWKAWEAPLVLGRAETLMDVVRRRCNGAHQDQSGIDPFSLQSPLHSGPVHLTALHPFGSIQDLTPAIAAIADESGTNNFV